MNLYHMLAARVGSLEARMLATELGAWHDDMVKHRRRALRDPASEPCSADCPFHAAPRLWVEARRVFGEDAGELRFLRALAGSGIDHPGGGMIARAAAGGPG
mgnify:CR=1 FL=1